MTQRVTKSTSLQLCFPTGEEENGAETYNTKTITNLNALASDEDVRAVADELSSLYKDMPTLIYRVDTAALRAA